MNTTAYIPSDSGQGPAAAGHGPRASHPEELGTPWDGRSTGGRERPTRRQTGFLGHLPALDGWRGIAILLVVAAHGQRAWLPPSVMDDGLRARVGELGGRGVELFFAISGILICFKLAESKIQDGMISLRSFYIRRFFRLVPAASVYLAAVGSLAAAGSLPASLGEILAAVFCYRNYHYAVNVGEGYYTAHFWSLSVEEHFYLLAPWLIAAGLGRAKFVLPAAAVSVAVWRAVEFRMGISASVFPRLTFNLLRTDLCLDHLIWSAWFGLLLAHPPSRRRLGFLGKPGFKYALLALAMADLLLVLPARKTWIAVAIPALLCGTILSSGGPLGRLLEARPLTWMGRLSYSLYLWQQLFLTIDAAPGLGWPLSLLQNFPFGIPAAFAAACCSYYFIEQPVRQWGRDQLRRWTERGPLTVDASGVPSALRLEPSAGGGNT